MFTSVLLSAEPRLYQPKSQHAFLAKINILKLKRLYCLKILQPYPNLIDHMTLANLVPHMIQKILCSAGTLFQLMYKILAIG